MAHLIGLIVGVGLFTWLHNSVGTDIASATANAATLRFVERSLKLDVEVAANQWLVAHSGLIPLAVAYYRLYYVPLVAVLLWVFLRHPRVFRTVLRGLVVMAPLALLVFWLVPMSPPRFALPGIHDIVAEHDPIAGSAFRDLTNGANHFSAMPSLHVGWSAMCAYAAWLALRSKHQRLALLIWLFPLGMVAVVITTGNHYVLDVVGSGALLMISIAAAAAWDRRPPRRGSQSKKRPST